MSEDARFGLSDRILLTRDGEDALAALRRGMRRASGFELWVVITRGAARREVVRRLGAWSGHAGVPELRVIEREEDARAAAESLVAGEEPGAVIAWTETWMDSGAIDVLNVGRDRLGQHMSGPLVLVVGHERAAELSRMAPDLWDVRQGTYEVAEREAPREVPPLVHRPLAQEPLARLHERAWDIDRSEAPAPAKADAWCHLAEHFFALGEQAEVLAAAERAHALAEAARYVAGMARARQLAAYAHYELGRTELASAGARAASDLHRALGDDRGLAGDELLLGHITRLDRGPEAAAHYEAALAHATAAGDSWNADHARIALAEVAIRDGALDRAERLLRGVSKTETEHPEGVVAPRAMATLALLLEKTGRWSEALEAIERAIRGSRHLDLANAHVQRANLLLQMENLAAAEEAARAGREVSAAAGYERGVANASAVLARIAARRSDFELARIHWEDAHGIIQRSRDRAAMARALGELGWLALVEGRADEAVELLQRAVEAAEVAHDPQQLADSRLGLAAAHLARHEHDAADTYARDAYVTLEHLNDARSRAPALRMLADIHAARGMHDEAIALRFEGLAARERAGDEAGRKRDAIELVSALRRAGRDAEAAEVARTHGVTVEPS